MLHDLARISFWLLLGLLVLGQQLRPAEWLGIALVCIAVAFKR